jgi:type IV pilus assembly protein PilV
MEVLVSVMVMSVGLLGLAGMHTLGMHGNHGAYLRTQATVLAYDILDRMRANPQQARDTDYNIAALSAVNASDADDAESLTGTARIDLAQWKSDLAVLPSADAVIDCDVDDPGLCVVTVKWDDSHARIRRIDEDADNENPLFVVSTRI